MYLKCKKKPFIYVNIIKLYSISISSISFLIFTIISLIINFSKVLRVKEKPPLSLCPLLLYFFSNF